MDYSLWLISLYTCLAMLTLIYRKFLLKYMCEINSLSSKFPWIIIYYLITERSPFKFYTKSNTDDPKHQRWLDPFRKGRPHPWKGSVFGRWPHTKVLDLPFSHLALQAAAVCGTAGTHHRRDSVAHKQHGVWCSQIHSQPGNGQTKSTPKFRIIKTEQIYFLFITWNKSLILCKNFTLSHLLSS